MFDKIGKGKNRRKLLELIKEDFPDTVIPEIDAASPYVSRIEALEKKLAERDQQEVEAKANRTIAQERRKLREAGWDDEGVERIESRMRETGNPDYESAAAWAKQQLPKDKPLPSTFAGQGYNWFTPPSNADDKLKMLASGPAGARRYQDAVVAEFLVDERNRKTGWGRQ